MPTPPLRDDLADQAYRSFIEHGRNVSLAANALGIPRSTFQNRCDKGRVRVEMASRGELGFSPVLPGFAIKSTASKAEDGSWVKQVKAPGEKFAVPTGHRLTGVSALSDADGVLLKWEKTALGPSPEDTVEALKEAFASLKPAPAALAPATVSADLLTVIPIADLHLGLFSWAKETGADYDLKIARELSLATVNQLVEASPASELAIVLDLGDFFHADDSTNRTGKSGNALDVDTRFAKVMQAGVELTVAFVTAALRRHKRVLYRKLAGNHDPHTSVALALALAAYFRDDPRVTVETDPSRFFFYQHGSVMLAATHGDMCKPEQMPGFAAAARAEMWGKTRHRYAYFGHVHHRSKRASELNGMYVETFGTLAAKDAWHASMGFSSQRSMSAISYHKASGEKSRNIVNID